MTEPRKTPRGASVRAKTQWVACSRRVPKKTCFVLARYTGVYPAEVVYYWFDGTNHHFGMRPATHWCPIPK